MWRFCRRGLPAEIVLHREIRTLGRSRLSGQSTHRSVLEEVLRLFVGEDVVLADGPQTVAAHGLGADAGLRMGLAYTYRIPLPDRVMQITPRALSRSLAHLGTRPLPLGLQLYAEFTKP